MFRICSQSDDCGRKIEEASPAEMSAIERKKMTAEISRLKHENEALKKTLRTIWAPLIEYMKGVTT